MKSKFLIGSVSALAFLSLPFYAALAQVGDSRFALMNPLKATSFCGFLHDIIDVVLMLAIPFAVLAVVWVGFRFIWAQGKEKELRTAKRHALYVFFGLLAIFGIWVVLNVVVNTIAAVSSNTIQACE